jgi:hypothetical protein
VAKKQVNIYTKVLRRIRHVAEKKVLDPAPLVRRVAGLDTVAPTVLITSAVVLALLSALLLKKAVDGRVTQVFCVTIAVCDLQPPELKHGCDIGVNSAFRKQRPFVQGHGRLACWHKSRKGHIAFAVVCEQLSNLGQQYF